MPDIAAYFGRMSWRMSGQWNKYWSTIFKYYLDRNSYYKMFVTGTQKKNFFC